MNNRPIKFRVWHKGKNQWVHPPGQEPHILGESVLLGGFCQVPLKELDDLEVLQFTGFLDKNSKEIYEGDIVEFQTLVHGLLMTDKVVFYGGSFCLEEMDYDLGEVGVTIIGNIFENPELLERKDS